MNGETSKIWYIFDKGVVKGPFKQDEVKELAAKEFSDGMIWKRGESQWEFVKNWKPQPASKSQDWKNIWYVCSTGYHSGPFSIQEICEKIFSSELPVNLKVWTLGLKKWIDIFEVSEVTDALGIPPRKHLRVPFVGDVKIQGLFKRKAAVAQTLSLGGIGITGLNAIRDGAKVNVTISSDLLREPVKAKARVVYQHEKESITSAGLEFVDLDQETQDVVADYIQQFE